MSFHQRGLEAGERLRDATALGLVPAAMLCLSALAAGCLSESGVVVQSDGATTTSDAGMDVGNLSDTATTTDAVNDSPAPVDLGVQDAAQIDAQRDLDWDATTDLGTDTGVDNASDASSDAAVDLGPPPDPLDRRPCETASCWDTEIPAVFCTTAVVGEDFATGRYNVHSYSATLYRDVPNRITLARTAGTWQPALIVAQSDGAVLYDGEVGLVRPGLSVQGLLDGGVGNEASVQITADMDLDVVISVTAWEVIDSAFVSDLPADAIYRLSVASDCQGALDLIAPEAHLAGELLAAEGEQVMELGEVPTWGRPVRVDANVLEHIGFRLDLTPAGASADLELLAWNGREVVSMALTNAGPGLRVLAAYDPFNDHTFWVRARASNATGALTVSRTPLDAGECDSDCARLLQLPVPVDPVAQGFSLPSTRIYREQFGRRELIMAILRSGYLVADAGYGPFEVQDISNWDGSQPCCHETHTGGFHADLSLLTAAGDPVWWSPGASFGDEPMALVLAGFFESGPYASGNPAEVILDTGFQDDVRAGADALLERGEITAETHGLFASELGLIYHYMGHDNHIHVRIDR